MSNVVNKLWGFCNTLRHDGINYGYYIEQLTCLLFLKLAEENRVTIPQGYGWSALKAKTVTKVLNHYAKTLRVLSKQPGILGDIFQDSISRFRDPANLIKLIRLIDETRWTELQVDLKAHAYEGLLQKYAVEQKGAGQYFTPREVIRCIVRCIRPDIRENATFTIHDPACGTAGFLVGAFEWTMEQTHNGADLKREDRERLQKRTFSGVEIVLETRRLALMNLYLHEIEAEIYYGDALANGQYAQQHYDCIMTNPPFGTKGAGEAPHREDFAVRTSNKQLNFLQHLMATLKPRGRAAIVLPDNVLFEERAGREVRKLLLANCNLHTVLRLPLGTFAPYAPGIKANALFFEKGLPTEEVWLYDLRTNSDKVTRGRPFTNYYFEDFEKCYHSQPRLENERFKRFSIQEVEARDYSLDILCHPGEQAESGVDLLELKDMINEMAKNMETAMKALNLLTNVLEESYS